MQTIFSFSVQDTTLDHHIRRSTLNHTTWRGEAQNIPWYCRAENGIPSPYIPLQHETQHKTSHHMESNDVTTTICDPANRHEDIKAFDFKAEDFTTMEQHHSKEMTWCAGPPSRSCELGVMCRASRGGPCLFCPFLFFLSFLVLLFVFLGFFSPSGILPLLGRVLERRGT